MSATVTAEVWTPTADRVSAARPELGEAGREYRSLIRKWWFEAAAGVPTMILSYRGFSRARRLVAARERAAAVALDGRWVWRRSPSSSIRSGSSSRATTQAKEATR